MSRQLSHDVFGRRTQSLSPISVEVSVDVSKTTLSSSTSNAEQAVRADIEAAFSHNSSLVDSLFSAATAAACLAQGIPSNLCPYPPSLALSLSNTGGGAPSLPETGTVLIPAVAGAIGGMVFVAAVMALLWRKAKSSRSNNQPSPPGAPGLVIRQLTAVPPAPPADDPSFSKTPNSKRFVGRTVFDPSGTF